MRQPRPDARHAVRSAPLALVAALVLAGEGACVANHASGRGTRRTNWLQPPDAHGFNTCRSSTTACVYRSFRPCMLLYSPLLSHAFGSASVRHPASAFTGDPPIRVHRDGHAIATGGSPPPPPGGRGVGCSEGAGRSAGRHRCAHDRRGRETPASRPASFFSAALPLNIALPTYCQVLRLLLAYAAAPRPSGKASPPPEGLWICCAIHNLNGNRLIEGAH
eukprot:364313-Chlamydomonas_euryale.AAC.5